MLNGAPVPDNIGVVQQTTGQVVGSGSSASAPSVNPVLGALTLDPKLLLLGAAGLAGAGLLVGGVALALSGDDAPRRGKGGRAYERFRGVTGSAKQYSRKGGGEVKYTKNGQPYVLDSNGRPKFIKR